MIKHVIVRYPMYELCFLYCFKCRLCISVNTGFRTKNNINTLGYTFNGSHFACNIFNLIILVKPVFILHGAFWSYFSHEHLTNIKPTLIQLSTLLMLATKWLAFGINTIPADALAPKVSNASAGMLLAMYDSEYVLLFKCFSTYVRVHPRYKSKWKYSFVIFRMI